MIKYAKIVNSQTGLCEVAAGDNERFYKNLGMIKIDVEKSEVDGMWYVAGKLQTEDYKAQVAEIKRQQQISEIKEKLEEIDMKSIRALRAGESENLSAYEEQAKALRTQLNNL